MTTEMDGLGHVWNAAENDVRLHDTRDRLTTLTPTVTIAQKFH